MKKIPAAPQSFRNFRRRSMCYLLKVFIAHPANQNSFRIGRNELWTN